MKRSEQFPEIREIADAVCSDSVTSEQLNKLEALLKGKPNAQRFYYDYVSMHTQLIGKSADNLEFVYRRLTEEIVVRPKNPFIFTDQNEALGNDENQVTRHNKFIYLLFLMLIVIVISLTWFAVNSNNNTYVAKLINGNVSIVGRGHIDGKRLEVGDYHVEQPTTLTLTNGDTLYLAPGSKIKLFNNDEIRLKRGKLTVKSDLGQNTIIHSRSFILLTNGSNLTLDLTQTKPMVSTGKNTLIIPNRWRPTHYWTFDGQSDRVIDSAGSAVGIASNGAKRVQGAIGRGAIHFDNTRSARIELGSGGGTAPGTGSFAVSDGVSIEALIKPEYSGEYKELDEIFRKDHGDDDLRMLLSFQHDKGKSYLKPEGEYAESLSFGLFILGQGYHELKLPLDGNDGRPTLAELKDGNYHHVVASYDVQSGIKAIYINGEKLAWYQYPPGSKMLSGGPGMAAIGNNPVEARWHEAFAGAIDEVAFYDFALTEFALQRHWQHVQLGHNYFGLPASEQALPNYIKWPLPAFSELKLNTVTGLPE